MSDISNLPNSKKIILKTRPDGDPKVSDFEMIEEVAKAVSYTHLRAHET